MLGCRGAFGVVTSLVTEALPLTSVTGGGLWFTGDGIEPAVRAYLRWTADVPETVNSSVLLIRLPDLPVIPEPIRGRRIAHLRITAVGGEAARSSSSSATSAARSPRAGPWSVAATPSTSSTPAARCPTRPRRRRRPPRRPHCTTRSPRGGIGAMTPAFVTGRHALDVAFSADDQAWLSRVKQAWDPGDLFRVAPFRVP
jgi:hypothetical protein